MGSAEVMIGAVYSQAQILQCFRFLPNDSNKTRIKSLDTLM